MKREASLKIKKSKGSGIPLFEDWMNPNSCIRFGYCHRQSNYFVYSAWQGNLFIPNRDWCPALDTYYVQKCVCVYCINVCLCFWTSGNVCICVQLRKCLLRLPPPFQCFCCIYHPERKGTLYRWVKKLKESNNIKHLSKVSEQFQCSLGIKSTSIWNCAGEMNNILPKRYSLTCCFDDEPENTVPQTLLQEFSWVEILVWGNIVIWEGQGKWKDFFSDSSF